MSACSSLANRNRASLSTAESQTRTHRPCSEPRLTVPFIGHHNPYTSAPYSQSIAAPSVTATPVQRAVTHSATPPLQVSPNVNLAQRLQQAQAQASQQPSMPAPSPARPNSGHATSANLSPQPASPGASQAREKERLALLLDINVELLQEINKLQAQGQGGAMNPQQAALYKANGQSDKMASDLYIQ